MSTRRDPFAIETQSAENPPAIESPVTESSYATAYRRERKAGRSNTEASDIAWGEAYPGQKPAHVPCFTDAELEHRHAVEPHMRATSAERPELHPIERWKLAEQRAERTDDAA